MVSEKKHRNKIKAGSRTIQIVHPFLPNVNNFTEGRQKLMAIARMPYLGRNDKEISVRSGGVYEVLDDKGSWWCLRTPTGKTGHVPRYTMKMLPNNEQQQGSGSRAKSEPVVVKVPILVETSVYEEKLDDTVSQIPVSHPDPPRTSIEKTEIQKVEKKELQPKVASPQVEEIHFFRPSNIPTSRRDPITSDTECAYHDYNRIGRRSVRLERSYRKLPPFRRQAFDFRHDREILQQCHSICDCCAQPRPQKYQCDNHTDENTASEQKIQENIKTQQPMIIMLDAKKAPKTLEKVGVDQKKSVNISLNPGNCITTMTICAAYPEYGGRQWTHTPYYY